MALVHVGSAPVVPGSVPVVQYTEAPSVINGVLQPPSDIKGIIDKTAQFVARNGPEFEARILKNEQNNNKFSFLVAKDPFHAYYKAKVHELGGAPADAPAAAAVSGSAQVTKEAEVKKRAPTVAPLEPPKPNFSVNKPVGAQPLDLDVIQLTAQFVARNGRSFLTGIANRESKNPQFDFLKPTHFLFPYFTSLVDAYSKCLAPSEELKSKLFKDSQDPMRVLTRMQQHAAFYRDKEKQKLDKETADDAERRANLLIDWHDFVVVETIGFEDDEEALPAPQDLSELVEKEREKENEKAKEKAEKAEKAEALEKEKAEAEAAESAASVPPPPEPTAEEIAAEEGAAAEELAPQPLEYEPEKRVVRKNYVPQVGTVQQSSVHFAVDPITKQQVRLDEMEEHMRISLLDPKWKEQKSLEEERRKDSNVAGDDDINKNLKSFAARRTDIFGDKEVAIGETVGVSAEQETRELAKKVIWDGHSSSIARTANMALQHGVAKETSGTAAPPSSTGPGAQAPLPPSARAAADGQPRIPPPPPPMSAAGAPPTRLPPPPGLAPPPGMGAPPGMVPPPPPKRPKPN